MGRLGSRRLFALMKQSARASGYPKPRAGGISNELLGVASCIRRELGVTYPTKILLLLAPDEASTKDPS